MPVPIACMQGPDGILGPNGHTGRWRNLFELVSLERNRTNHRYHAVTPIRGVDERWVAHGGREGETRVAHSQYESRTVVPQARWTS